MGRQLLDSAHGGSHVPSVRYRVMLSEEERAELLEISSKGKQTAQRVKNALILLGCDEGPHQTKRSTGAQLAQVLQISQRKIDRVKQRCVEEGVDAALDRKPPERLYERKVDGDIKAHLVALSCTSPPEGRARWSLRLLADRMVELGYVESISHETVRNVLKKTR